MRTLSLVLLLALAAAPGLSPAAEVAPAPAHGMSMYGELTYGRDFRHFAYVNPAAPKGGIVKLSALGTFDTLNPFTLKGVPAAGSGQVFDTLLVQSADEAFAMYGLVAETVEAPADRSWVAFTIRREARFHDGTPITVDDVIWTFDTLRTKGHPQYRSYYAQVAKAEAAGPRRVRFTFKPGVNRELPLIVGQLPVLPKAWWAARAFSQTTLEPPLGSGPYRVESVDPGRSLTYARVKDYWAAKLPVNVGRFNVDTIRYDYYRDAIVAIEGLKAGAFDFRQENVSKSWATAYDIPAVHDGRIKKEEIPHEIPLGMQGFVYNTRRAIFRDVRVREALAYAFDFEWTNKHLFYGGYKRSASYFSNSELASREYRPPSTEPGGIRPNLVAALKLLESAGWVVRDLRLVNAATGQPMMFEILLDEPTWERITLPFVENLKRLGVTARIRTVDSAQYEYRTKNFDYDMVVGLFPQSLSPGNEQADFWSSEAARTPGSRNLPGVSDPAVDRLIDEIITAPDRATLIARTQALDRTLLAGHYVIPHWHLPAFRVVYWDKFGRPPRPPKYELGFEGWWIRPEKR